MKKNLIFIIPFLLIFSILVINTKNYISNSNILINKDLNNREVCKYNNNLTIEQKKHCDYLNNTEIYKPNFYEMFNNIFIINMKPYSLIIFLLITFPSIYFICNFFKNNGFNYYLTRKSYKKTILDLFIKSSKSIFILPILAILFFIFFYFYTGGFDYNTAINNNLVSWSINTIKYPFIFMSSYIIKLFLIGIIYHLIAIIVCRKNHNIISSCLISYFSFIGINIFLELFINRFISQYIFKSDFGLLFNIVTIFSFSDKYSLFYFLLVPIILIFILTIIIYKIYSNREEMIMECEKNF